MKLCLDFHQGCQLLQATGPTVAVLVPHIHVGEEFVGQDNLGPATKVTKLHRYQGFRGGEIGVFLLCMVLPDPCVD